MKNSDRWKNISIKFLRNVTNPLLRKFLYVFYVAVLIIKEAPDLLVFAHPGLGSIAFFIKKILGLKYAVVTHGTDVWDIDRGFKYIGLMNADLIITVSKYTKDKMISNGIDGDKIKIIPNTIDLSLFAPKPTNEKMAEQFRVGNKTILFTSGRISSLERYKGHDELLDLMRKLDDSFIWIAAGEGMTAKG